MSRMMDGSKGLLEEHVILRVPPELSERVQAVVSRPEGLGEKINISVESGEKPRDLLFKIGEDTYYATLRDLPTVVETEKTKDSYVYYKSSDISQVVEVQNVKVGSKPRPEVAYLMDDGLTPPMKQARSQRFKRMDRAVKNGLPEDIDDRKRLIGRMDQQLHKIVDKLSEDKTTVLQYDELIDMEPYMQYWDDRTIIKQGLDNFLTDSRHAYDLAYANFSNQLKKLNIDPALVAKTLAANADADSNTSNSNKNTANDKPASATAMPSSNTSNTPAPAAPSRNERPSIKMVDMSDIIGAKKKKSSGTLGALTANARAAPPKPATSTPNTSTPSPAAPPPPPPPPSTNPKPTTKTPPPPKPAATPPGASTPPPQAPAVPSPAAAATPAGSPAPAHNPEPAKPNTGPTGALASAIAAARMTPASSVNPSPSPPGAMGSSSSSSSSTSGPAPSPNMPTPSPSPPQPSPSPPPAMPSASPSFTPGVTPGGTPGATPGGTPGPMPSPPPGGDEDPAMAEIRNLEREVRKTKLMLDQATLKMKKAKNVILQKRFREQVEKVSKLHQAAQAKLKAAREKLNSS